MHSVPISLSIFICIDQSLLNCLILHDYKVNFRQLAIAEPNTDNEKPHGLPFLESATEERLDVY